MKKYLFLLLIIFLSHHSECQTISEKGGGAAPPPPEENVYTLDLSSSVHVNTFQVENDIPIKIKVINLAPGASYSFTNRSAVKLEVPLSTEKSLTDPNDCDKLEKKLHDTKSESEFGILMTNASEKCPSIYNKYLKASVYDYKALTLHNETLTVTITNTDTKATWTFTFETKEKGKFLTTYGFTYIPYLLSKSHTYYAKQQSGTTPPTYALTPYAYDSEKHAEFAPTIMFHYLDYMDEKWSASWTAGLGINFNTDINNGIAPLVFAGRSFIYHQNIGLSIGLAAHMLNGLKGNFDISTPISTNLETGDITEKHIGINPFVSITFRFSSSPFTKKAASDSVLQPAH